MSDEYEYDLFWFALNYRLARGRDAEQCWQELVACVNRLIERGEPV